MWAFVAQQTIKTRDLKGTTARDGKRVRDQARAGGFRGRLDIWLCSWPVQFETWTEAVLYRTNRFGGALLQIGEQVGIISS